MECSLARIYFLFPLHWLAEEDKDSSCSGWGGDGLHKGASSMRGRFETRPSFSVPSAMLWEPFTYPCLLLQIQRAKADSRVLLSQTLYNGLSLQCEGPHLYIYLGPGFEDQIPSAHGPWR
jgi:hypothetical protein